MKKVEKSVNEVMEWMNNIMNAQAKKSLDQDPVVRAQEIRAKIKVRGIVWCVLLGFLRASGCNPLNLERSRFCLNLFTSSQDQISEFVIDITKCGIPCKFLLNFYFFICSFSSTNTFVEPLPCASYCSRSLTVSVQRMEVTCRCEEDLTISKRGRISDCVKCRGENSQKGLGNSGRWRGTQVSIHQGRPC